ncbi:MAG: KEOPS complex kinase/ATPase Bud32 [Thermoplasmata archaeon]
MDEIIGSEGIIFRDTWFGREVIVKKRVSKEYRALELDNKIRTSRIKHEVKMMMHAKHAKVRVPMIYDINLVDFSIVMEYIPGITLREYLKSNNDMEPLQQYFDGIIKLHSHYISHGDPTTSNVIVNGKEVVFIDFSLGKNRSGIEELAVDIHLIRETFNALHYQYKEMFNNFIEKYSKAWIDGSKVMEKEKEIRLRARYT